MRRIAVLLAVLAVAAPAAQAQQRPLVTFTRTGGFIGATDQLSVSTAGRVTSSRGSYRISTARLLALRRSLIVARFATLRPKYLAAVPIADGYTYGIRYAGRSVLVEEGAETPTRLAKLVRLLDGLLWRGPRAARGLL